LMEDAPLQRPDIDNDVRQFRQFWIPRSPNYTAPCLSLALRMPLFNTMAGGAYTSEAWENMLKNPQDRIEIVSKAVENLGGSVVGGWLSFDLGNSVPIPALGHSFTHEVPCRPCRRPA
jgi:hypothetical protein